MVAYDKAAVREKLMAAYDKKINNATKKSKYDAYIILYAELRIGVDEALALAEKEAASTENNASSRKCYSQFCINFQRMA